MYWLAESWEKIKPETIKNSWHNILTTKDLKHNNKKKKNQEHFEIKNTVLQLLGSEMIKDNCVEELLYGDEEEEITDDAIICMITKEEIDETEKIISHAKGTTELDVVLHYIEQQPDALPRFIFEKLARQRSKKETFCSKTNNFRFIFSTLNQV
ncbi:hypothetical protein AVEN_267344-1 [Araneus ventricosus]|uniref:Uncharacterized protein n=1 Tax=Araneus ventricosus TaxID=182803 RepID=A0A4Y2DJI1_ARAVE|nr:hypothetical protein AVEN_267344-1 [Araneus ventricosus]